MCALLHMLDTCEPHAYHEGFMSHLTCMNHFHDSLSILFNIPAVSHIFTTRSQYCNGFFKVVVLVT